MIMNDYAKYINIANQIKQKIISNFYINGQLPSEKQLCIEYDVSRRTVQRSIKKLADDGFVHTVAGKGTFVHLRSTNKYEISLNINDILINGYDIAKIYSTKIQKPNINQVYNLQVAPNERVFCNQWIIMRDERIVAYDVKTLPYFQGIPIDESDLSYKTLREMLGSKFSQFELKEEVSVTCIIANEELCCLMEIEENDQPFLVCIDVKIYDSDMMPLAWNELYIKAEECEFNGELINYDE